MRSLERVALIALVVLTAGCGSPFVLRQETVLSQSVGEFSKQMKQEATSTVAAERSARALATPTAATSVTAGDVQLEFLDIVCGYGLLPVRAGLGGLSGAMEDLDSLGKAPDSKDVGTLIGSIADHAAAIRQINEPSSVTPKTPKPNPEEVCKAQVIADMGWKKQSHIAFTLALPLIAAADVLAAGITQITTYMEEAKRAEAVQAYVKANKTQIMVNYYILACPVDTTEAVILQHAKGVTPAAGENPATRCGKPDDGSRLHAMLLRGRTLTLERAYEEFIAVRDGAPKAPPLAPEQRLKRRGWAEDMSLTLQRYDGYRAFVNVDARDGILSDLYKALTNGLSAIENGPTASGDVLASFFEGVSRLNTILKVRADFIKARSGGD